MTCTFYDEERMICDAKGTACGNIVCQNVCRAYREKEHYSGASNADEPATDALGCCYSDADPGL